MTLQSEMVADATFRPGVSPMTLIRRVSLARMKCRLQIFDRV